MNNMRILLALLISLSFNFIADERDGLPELATDAKKKELQARRSKVLTPSTAKRVQALSSKGDFEKAENQSKKILTLPINQYLKENEIRFISDKINQFYN